MVPRKKQKTAFLNDNGSFFSFEKVAASELVPFFPKCFIAFIRDCEQDGAVSWKKMAHADLEVFVNILS